MSLVKDFYKDANILITGGTGFLGKVLIEKLLRTYSDIGDIYVLVRPKKGHSLAKRIENILNDPLFDLLKSANPLSKTKIVPIMGNISENRLGISIEDRKLLIQKIDVIFHVAASIKFDDFLNEAILTNVRSAREMALLALEMKNLKAFLHVSTAYSYSGKKKIVPEEFHLSKGNWRDAIYLAENGESDLINMLTHKYIEGFPNTYTYTKHLAEYCIRELLEFKIPTVIVRPTIVVNTIEEPMPGWTDNLNGTVGILIACNTGLVRNLNADENVRLDNITVDTVIKAFILAAWKAGTKSVDKHIEVIHLSSNKLRQLKIKELVTIGIAQTEEIPFEKAIWVPGFSCSASWYCYYLKFVLFQILPAILLDVLVKLTGRKKFLLKIQRKAFITNLVLRHFMNNNWIFKNDKFFALFDYLEDEEKKYFSFRFPHTDKELCDFTRSSLDYARLTVMKESKEIKPKTRRIRKIMYFLDAVVKMAFYCLCLWIIFIKLDITSIMCNYLRNNNYIVLLKVTLQEYV